MKHLLICLLCIASIHGAQAIDLLSYMSDAKPIKYTFRFDLDMDTHYKTHGVKGFLIEPELAKTTPIPLEDTASKHFVGRLQLDKDTTKYLLVDVELGPIYQFKQNSRGFCFKSIEFQFTGDTIECHPIHTVDMLIAHALTNESIDFDKPSLKAVDMFTKLREFDKDNENWDVYRQLISLIYTFFIGSSDYGDLSNPNTQLSVLLDITKDINDALYSERELSIAAIDRIISKREKRAINTTFKIHVNLDTLLEPLRPKFRYSKKTETVLAFFFNGTMPFKLDTPSSFKLPLIEHAEAGTIAYSWPWARTLRVKTNDNNMVTYSSSPVTLDSDTVSVTAFDDIGDHVSHSVTMRTAHMGAQ